MDLLGIYQLTSQDSNSGHIIANPLDQNTEKSILSSAIDDKSLTNTNETYMVAQLMPEKATVSLETETDISEPATPVSNIDSSPTEENCCLEDHSANDYEMISISSWDLNLSVSGDEDALECDADLDKNILEAHSETTTVANSPNVACCSAKTPVKSMEASAFFQKVYLKRRNAVRHDCKPSKRRPSWGNHRPQSDRCLHNKISPDAVCNDGEQCDGGITIEYFVDSSDHSIFSTLNEFRRNSIYGDVPQFTTYSNPLNVTKNRYSDIPCIEESRVKLVRDISGTSSTDGATITPTDYIHANWVDGYRQKNAYICTQGPLLSTASDFWHMIIQYRSPIIVMTTRPCEQNRDKCLQYWPEKVGEKMIIAGINDRYDSFEVACLRSKEFGPNCPKKGVCGNTKEHWYRVALLHVKNCRTGKEHRVNHFYFHSWPDQGIPYSSEGFLHFILQIRRTYILNIAKLDYESEMDQCIPPPPIVVHCSAGIGRSGTYVVTDICTKSLSDCGRFNLYQTMLKVRSQRYKSIQNAHQYIYCRNTIIDYARQIGMLERDHKDNPGDEEGDEEEEEGDNEDEEMEQCDDDKYASLEEEWDEEEEELQSSQGEQVDHYERYQIAERKEQDEQEPIK